MVCNGNLIVEIAGIDVYAQITQRGHQRIDLVTGQTHHIGQRRADGIEQRDENQKGDEGPQAASSGGHALLRYIIMTACW